MRYVIAISGLLALAGCGGGDQASSGNAAAPAAKVAGKAAPAGQQWQDVVVRTPDGGWLMGNPDAPIKLVEFGSRSCSHCAEFEAVGFDPLTTKYVASGRVSYEYRDFLRNGGDLAAALIGGCGGTGPFFALLKQMFADQGAMFTRMQAVPQATFEQIATLPPSDQPARMAELAGYIDFAKQRGLPEAKVRQCLADPVEAKRLVDMNTKANADYSIPGTPTFLINGKIVDGAAAWEPLEAALKNAGA